MRGAADHHQHEVSSLLLVLICLAAALPVVHLVVGTVLAPPNIALELLLAHNTLVLGRAPSLEATGGSQGTRADNVSSRLILEGLRQQPAPPGAQPGNILVSEFTQVMMIARASGLALARRLQSQKRTGMSTQDLLTIS